MQQTAQFEIEVLDDNAIDAILALFRGLSVRITVEVVEDSEVLEEMVQLSQEEIYEIVKASQELFKTGKAESPPGQLTLYHVARKVRERFENSQLDPQVYLTNLANEVNL